MLDGGVGELCMGRGQRGGRVATCEAHNQGPLRTSLEHMVEVMGVLGHEAGESGRD